MSVLIEGQGRPGIRINQVVNLLFGPRILSALSIHDTLIRFIVVANMNYTLLIYGD